MVAFGWLKVIHVTYLAGGLSGCQNNSLETSQFDNNTGQPM